MKELVDGFDGRRVVVVGDVYLDELRMGRMTGVSLETPVPVVEVEERRHNPGAAGNVACNLAAMGAQVTVVGVMGDDANADDLQADFETVGVDASGLFVDPGQPTNTYGKLLARTAHGVPQEILRTDTPAPDPLQGELEDAIIRALDVAAEGAEAIVVIDQINSVATERVLKHVAELGGAGKILTVGDSRSRIGQFQGFDLAVPNDGELAQALGTPVERDAELQATGQALLKVCESALVTCGERGIRGFGPSGSFTSPAHTRDVVDVTGAGDTATAAATLALLAGANLEEAAYLANAAAAVAVAQPGVVTVSRNDLQRSLAGAPHHTKIVPLPALPDVVAGLKRAGKTVVWTNGCFDIIHAGHVLYLQRAAEEGDALVVGLNSDASVCAIKGPERPIVPESERALILAAFGCVDYVTLFDETSPLHALEQVQPDVYAKGGDYTLDTIDQDERRVVEGYGGRIAIIPGVEGRSTTNIVQRLAQEYEE